MYRNIYINNNYKVNFISYQTLKKKCSELSMKLVTNSGLGQPACFVPCVSLAGRLLFTCTILGRFPHEASCQGVLLDFTLALLKAI